MERPLHDDVRALLRDRIESVEQLEVLILLQRRREHSWTAEAVAGELDLSPPQAARALDHLCRGNLLDVRVGTEALAFRYNPGTPELEDVVVRVARAYAEARVDVLSALSIDAVERARTYAMRMFADAFVIGRGKKNG